MRLTITKKIVGLFLLFLMLAVTNILVIYHYQTMQRSDSQVVDAAGYQRMLSQRITKFALSVANGNNGSREVLRKSLLSYDAGFNVLKFGGVHINHIVHESIVKHDNHILPPAPEDSQLEKLFEENARVWRGFKENALIIVEEKRDNPRFKKSLMFIIENNEQFLVENQVLSDKYDELTGQGRLYSHEINVAGRQMMLTQRMIKYALSIVMGGGGIFKNALLESIDLYDQSLNVLQYGGVSTPWNKKINPASPEILPVITQLRQHWYQFKEQIDTIHEESKNNQKFSSAVTYILDNNDKILDVNSQITSRFAAIFSKRVLQLRTLLMVMLGFDILIFFVGVWKVQNVVKPLNYLSEVVGKLADSGLNKEITIPKTNDEIENLATVFNKMVKNLHKTTFSRDYVDNIIETMIDTLIVVDEKGFIKTANNAICKLLQYEKSDLVGMPFKSIVSKSFFREKSYLDMLDEAAQINCETLYRKKNNEMVPVFVSGALMYGTTTVPMGVVVVGKDISEIKEVESEMFKSKKIAEAANKAKSNFLASMSHEIRTPMNAILGYTQVLRRDNDLSSRHRDCIKRIDLNGRHLMTLINDILDISKIEAGKMDLYSDNFNLTETVKSISGMLSIRCEQINLEWGLNLPQKRFIVFGDEGKLRQILINLLGNAIKFTEKGKVTLSMTRVESFIKDKSKSESFLFEVEDTGLGIPQEKLNSIFDPFDQGIHGIKKGGTGLGLAIAKKHVKLMGGELLVESKVDKGSRFYFTISLPVIEADRDVNGDGGILKGIDSVRVLVMDDNGKYMHELSCTLKEIGIKAEIEKNNNLLDRVHDIKPDVVLVNTLKLSKEAKGAITLVRSEFSMDSLKIVLLTGESIYSGSRTMEEYEPLGFNDTFSAPLTLKQISELFVFLFSDKIEGSENNNRLKFLAELKEIDFPDQILEHMKEAAELYQITKLDTLLDQIEDFDKNSINLVKHLKMLVTQYDMDSILKIIKEYRREKRI